MTDFDWEAQRQQQIDDWKRNNEAALKAMTKSRQRLFKSALGVIEPLPEKEVNPNGEPQVKWVVRAVSETMTEPQIKEVVRRLSKN